MRRRSCVLVVLFYFLLAQPVLAQSSAEEPPELTVQMIMQDHRTWIGAWPSRPYWTDVGDKLYFYWNPKGAYAADSLFSITPGDASPKMVSDVEQQHLGPAFSGWQHGRRQYNDDFSSRVYSRGNDLYILDVESGKASRLTKTRDREQNPHFTVANDGLIFQKSNNLFRLHLDSGLQEQLTDFRQGQKPAKRKPGDKDAFLQEQQLQLFEHIQSDEESKEEREAATERRNELDDAPAPYFFGSKDLRNMSLDPTERFVSFMLSAENNRKNTLVQDYVTETGYARDLTARSKVGGSFGKTTLHIHDLEQDTTYQIDLHQLEGSYDVPAYLQSTDTAVDSAKTKRELIPSYLDWHPTEAKAMLQVRARDNKDRWIALLDPEDGSLELLDRQHDDAWIGGPGISRFSFGQNEGWLLDGKHYYFQSEQTGFSHLYTVNAETGHVKALTSGSFEVFSPMLSKDGTTWFFSSSEGSPHERHFYHMPVAGGERTRITSMPGNNQIRLAPDEQTMGILHSYSNRPPEVFIQREGEEIEQATYSTSDAWRAYPWRDPEIIQFEASDGVSVPARIYEPEEPNGAAVLFVHGAGYLQNVHRWWSSYFREYMFHNLLADRGYTVLDVDYRASAGYGRDWRTAIYRYMGGRDLQDYVDASRYLDQEKGIDPEKVFIYGGSYGGFITLMALFNEPEHFGGGAALRSVTDWAHYNHGYTSNILNTPAKDSLAFARSSPIYFAEGLEDPLLIAHGMVDTNVQFQDVVRLAQRLIELGKEGWEMAVYPVEGHGFREPSSWTDEYRRILELIEESVGPN